MDNTTGRSEALRAPRGWYSRGYLPHFDGGKGLPQSVTFRLADSVPAVVIEQWLAEVSTQPALARELELRKRLERYLDAGYGACYLQDTRIGSIVEQALVFFDSLRYHLHAWVIMPNHVHVLFTPAKDCRLGNIVSSWKSFTAKEANRVLHRSGRFWKEEYFDRFIRDAAHFNRTVDYIENNPVKAGLCDDGGAWPFGSARFRHVAEAAETAAVPGREQ